MAEVSVREARNNLSRLIKQAQAGDDVVIASRGKPIARIVAVRETHTGTSLAAWLRKNQVASERRTRAEVDAYLSSERDAWE
jgi:prevent-host-death family protein